MIVIYSACIDTARRALCKFLVLLLAATSVALINPSLASATAMLGSAQGFSVLGHDTVTNAHSAPNSPTQVYGDLGVTPGTAVTGFYPDGTVSGGTIHIDDAVAQLALIDATNAYNTMAGLAYDYDYTGIDLGGATLTPGVYHFDSTASLTGTLTLDFQGNPFADFIFQAGSTLTTAGSSTINVINGGTGNGVYWQVGSSATLGADSIFVGNILALASVTLNPRAGLSSGRVFALTGAVTMTDNLISNNAINEDYGSGRTDFGSYGYSGGDPAIPEPATMLLFGSGLAGLAAYRRKRKEKW